jgi:hypothetical protein
MPCERWLCTVSCPGYMSAVTGGWAPLCEPRKPLLALSPTLHLLVRLKILLVPILDLCVVRLRIFFISFSSQDQLTRLFIQQCRLASSIAPQHRKPDLSAQEMASSVTMLLTKVARICPHVTCIIGK